MSRSRALLSVGLAGAVCIDCCDDVICCVFCVVCGRVVVVPLLTALPLWWRFMQCLRRYRDTGQRFPHLANALKYALSHSVLLFGVFNPALKAPLPLQVLIDRLDGGDGEVDAAAADAAEAAAADAAAEAAANAVIVSPYQVIWLMFMVASTLYTFSWDVAMDWDLGHFDSPNASHSHSHSHLHSPTGAAGGGASLLPTAAAAHIHSSSGGSDVCCVSSNSIGVGSGSGSGSDSKRGGTSGCGSSGLRDQLIFKKPQLYWIAIGVDLVLRFAWSLTLIPRGSDSPLPQWLTLYLDPALAALEIMRRCMWGCLRLEHEHLRLKLDGPMHPNSSSSTSDSSTPDTPSAASDGNGLAIAGGSGNGGSGSVLLGSEEHNPARGWQVVFEVTIMAMTVIVIGGLAAISNRPPSST